MKGLLLTAGEGTRFRPHTLALPKPALPFLNIPLAYFTFNLIDELPQPLSLAANTFHKPEGIESLFRNHPEVQLFHEKKEILGSGGGLKNVEKFFSGEKHLFLANGDEITFPHHPGQFLKAFEEHKKNDRLATLVVMEHEKVGSQFGGVWVNRLNQIVGFGKTRPAEAHRGLHFIGFQFLSQRIFSVLPSGSSNILHDVLVQHLKTENIGFFEIKASWFEAGNLQDYLKATSQALNILNSQSPGYFSLKQALDRFSPGSEFRNENGNLSLIHQSSRSQPQVKDFAVVGENCLTPEKFVVKGSVIGPGCEIRENQKIENEFLLSNSPL